MRWDNLRIDAEEEKRLPRFKEPAVVRTFDAPEALGTRFYEVRARSGINQVPKRSRMPFRFTINPYRGCAHACIYCFARPTHTYLDFNAREDFEREIVVKVNVPELVRAELGRPSWGGDHVALGTNTDPYQWVEGRYRLMEGIWEAMRDHANPCSVLTKSPLLLRDVELFRQLREVTEFSTALSVPTIDERAWRETEPHTPHPRKRLEAVGELTRNGIPCSVLVAPLIPGVNDDPRQVEEILEIAGENGAANVTGIGLHLRRDVRDIFFDWLRQYRPDLVPHYEELYQRGAYLPSEEKKRLGALTRGFRRRPGSPRPSGFGGRGVKRKNAEESSPRQKPPEAKQPSLF
jgi:DNA repair photolyase